MYSKSYLSHHGRMGQKWGKRNGPPYPLDYSKLSSEEREQAKAKAIERGDVREANANKDFYSNKELQDVITRFNMKKQIAELDARQIKSGWDKANEMANKLGTIANLAVNGTRAYNAIANVSNTFLGTKLTKIGEAKTKEAAKTTANLEKFIKNASNIKDEKEKK